MGYTNVVLEEREPGVYLLTVDRPKVLNALDAATVAELDDAVAAVDAAAGARALVLTGAGERAFVAGADIREMLGLGALEAKDWSARAQRAFRRLETLPVPTVAAVRGYCLGGGCELALSCDWIVAGDDAVFGLPEVGLGVIPGGGGTQRLTRLVGRARAMEWIATGRTLRAQEARELGLVNHVLPAGRVLEEALGAARTVASRGPVAVRLAKEAVQRGQDLDLDNACALESQLFGLCFATADQREGMAAFVEKRAPGFRGT